MSKNKNNSLIYYFKIKEITKFITKNYYYNNFMYCVKIYVKRYNICLILKMERYILNKKLQIPLILKINEKIY